jgi:hypothetical protein
LVVTGKTWPTAIILHTALGTTKKITSLARLFHNRGIGQIDIPLDLAAGRWYFSSKPPPAPRGE